MTRGLGSKAAAVVVLACASTLALAPRAAGAAVTANAGVRRVLVVSLPTVSWEDLDLTQLPHLRTLLSQSAVADLSVRSVRRRPTLADGYVTVGAGTRSVSRADGGQCFDANERIEGGIAREALARRTGVDARTITDRSVVCLQQPAIRARNDKLLFDADVGVLGATLAANGVGRAVIGNADDKEPPSGRVWQRSVGLMLADRNGVVADGEVGGRLLERDPAAPFGVRSSPAEYLAAFDRVWRGRAVVVVEASDLERYDNYRASVASAARPGFQERVLHATDDLVGHLMTRVDPTRDAVIVVGMSQRDGPGRLTVAALRAPGVAAGLLRSAYTRHAGITSIVDVAPTILDQLGIERPDTMEGRPFEIARRGGDAPDRFTWLIDTNKAAQFRDREIPQVTGWFVALQIILTLAALIAFVRLGRRSLVAVELAALTLLGFLPATFLAGLLPFYRFGVAPYWVFLFGVAALLAFVAWYTTSRSGVTTLIVALGAIVGVILVDVATGARLQFDTAFGYSPTVAGRFAGLGNLGYAQLAAGAVLLAGLVAFRVGGRRGAWIAVAILAAAVVVDGAPFFGSDIGGVLSMTPASAVTATLLLGWRFRWKLVVLYGGVALAVLGVFAAIDLSRPPDKRSHLGRLIETGTGNGGWHRVSIVIERKLSENGAVFFSSVWTIMMPLVLAGIAYLIYRAPGRMHGLHQRMPQLSAGLIGLGVVAGLGLALNDSGVAIPGVMLGVMTPVLIIVTVRGDRVTPTRARGAELDAIEEPAGLRA